MENKHVNMDKNLQKKLIEALTLLAEQKGITKEEVKNYLIEVFTKAFNKTDDWDYKNPIEEADVIVNLDIEQGSIKVSKRFEIVNEIDPIKKLKQLLPSDEKLVGKHLNVGDTFEEHIDLSKISQKQLQHIKQLLIQKTREAEKNKLYQAFSSRQGTLVNAKVFRVEENYAILDIDGVSIFMPKSEMNPMERLQQNSFILVYITKVDPTAKDAQIVASRASAFFVSKLIEQEIDDVGNGTVTINAVARQVGYKTKIAVSTLNQDIDPVGSLIGVKGTKIKIVQDAIHNERIDVIPYYSDIKKFIATALAPAKIKGIKMTSEEEGKKHAIVVVDDSEFLSAIGKQGINVKLAAKLTGVNIDVKTLSTATEEGIEFESVDVATGYGTTKFADRKHSDSNRGLSHSHHDKHDKNQHKSSKTTSIDDILNDETDSDIDMSEFGKRK